jgi:hypothetical protein
MPSRALDGVCMFRYAHQRTRSMVGGLVSTHQDIWIRTYSTPCWLEWGPHPSWTGRRIIGRRIERPVRIYSQHYWRPHVVVGTKGMAVNRRWYADFTDHLVDFTEVTRSALIGGRNLEKCVDKQIKRRKNTQRTTHVSKRSDTEVARKDNEMQRELLRGITIR